MKKYFKKLYPLKTEILERFTEQSKNFFVFPRNRF